MPSGSCTSFRYQSSLKHPNFHWKTYRTGLKGLTWQICLCLQTSKLASHLKSARMKITIDHEPYTTKTHFVINVAGGFGLFLAPDPIPDTRLTAIILAIPSNSEKSKSHLLPLQLWHIPLVLVRVLQSAAMHAKKWHKKKKFFQGTSKPKMPAEILPNTPLHRTSWYLKLSWPSIFYPVFFFFPFFKCCILTHIPLYEVL